MDHVNVSYLVHFAIDLLEKLLNLTSKTRVQNH